MIEFNSRFPIQTLKKRQCKARCVDGIKYFSHEQIQLLRRKARDQAELDLQKGKITGVREWMAVDLKRQVFGENLKFYFICRREVFEK